MPSAERRGEGPTYEILIAREGEEDLGRLDPSVRSRILSRLRWLAAHADSAVHHGMTSLPDDLQGLCRLRAGDWRVRYWVYHDARRLVVYRIAHRSEAYRRLK